MTRTPPVPRLVVRLRLRWRWVLTAWMFFLCRAAGKMTAKGEAIAGHKGPSRDRLRRRNQSFQEELGRIFAPYFIYCPQCESSCCRHFYLGDAPASRPGSPVDGLVYEGAAATPAGPPGDLREGARYLLRIFLGAGLLAGSPAANGDASADPGAPQDCPDLTPRGCRLPWGERPVGCVLYLCDEFARRLSWGDYGRYVWVSFRYLAFLTGFLHAAIRSRRKLV